MLTFSGNLGPIASGGGVTTNWITSVGLDSSLRDDFTGILGTRFWASNNVTVVSLGRWIYSGNSTLHTLKLYDASSNLLASAQLNASGLTTNQFAYATCSPQPVLTVGNLYWLLSTETNLNGDYWGNAPTNLASSSVAVSAGPGYYDYTSSTFISAGGASTNLYIPVNFQYHP